MSESYERHESPDRLPDRQPDRLLARAPAVDCGGLPRSRSAQPAVRDLLASAARCLLEASAAERAGERFAAAHLAALRAAAAVLASCSRPNRRSRPRSVWELLAKVAPELDEWSLLFAAGASKRAAAEAGLNVVTAREADDLMRDAEAFLGLVANRLGFGHQLVVPASPLRTVG